MWPSSTAKGHKRPLSPPQSRESIRSQLAGINQWEVVDASEDLRIYEPQKRIKLGSVRQVRPRSSDCQAMNDSLMYNPETCPPNGTVTGQDMQQWGFDVLTNSSGVLGHDLGPSEGLSINSTRSAGAYLTNTICSELPLAFRNDRSSRAPVDTVKHGAKHTESDLEEALRLARATNDDNTTLQDNRVQSLFKQTQTKHNKPIITNTVVEQLEIADQERSRQLREKALARRQASTANKAVSVSSSPSGSQHAVDTRRSFGDLSDNAHVEVGFSSTSTRPSSKTKTTNPLSSSDQAQLLEIDRIFSIANKVDKSFGYSAKENRIGTHSRGAFRHRFSPASRAAAELYRTQNRHLGSHACNKSSGLDTFSKSAGSLTEGERRLRALTSLDFKRSDAVKCSSSGKPPGTYEENATLAASNDHPRAYSKEIQASTITKNNAYLHAMKHSRDESTENVYEEGDIHNEKSNNVEADTNTDVENIDKAENGNENSVGNSKDANNEPNNSGSIEDDNGDKHVRNNMTNNNDENEVEGERELPSLKELLEPLTQVNRDRSVRAEHPQLYDSQQRTSETRFPPLKPTSNATQQTSPQKHPLTSDVGEPDDNYPVKPTLSLPRAFHRYDEHLKDIITECETLRERERDLLAIIPAFEPIAKVGSLAQFSDREVDELRTVQQFTRAVVGQGLSGKKRRNRVNAIAKNMRRRLEKHDTYDGTKVDELLNRLLKQERREHIMQLISSVQARLDGLREERDKAMKAWRNRRDGKPAPSDMEGSQSASKCKKVLFTLDRLIDTSGSFADLPDGAEIELPGLDNPAGSQVSATERKRNAQYAFLDKREATIREKLALFNRPNQAEEQIMSSDANHAFQQDEDVSEESEEEEGAEHFSAPIESQVPKQDTPTTRPTQPAVDKHSNRETQQTGVVTKNSTSTSQAQHEGLATSMQRKQNQNAIRGQQNAQKPNLDLAFANRERAAPKGATCQSPKNKAEDDADQEFDDMGSRSRRSDSEIPTCYRYTVKAQYTGVEGIEVDHEHILGRYLMANEASKKLNATSEELVLWYRENLKPGLTPVIRKDVVEEDGLETQAIALGDGGQMSLRVWIEKEEFQPSEEAYKNAKVRKACRASAVYAVIWERTITPASAILKLKDGHTEEHTNPPAGCETQADESSSSNTNDTNTSNTSSDESQHQNSNDDDNDSLFGPDIPSPPTTPPSGSRSPLHHLPTPNSVKTSIKFPSLRLFSGIAHANRHAKDVFMRWYMDHLRGAANFGYITQEEDAIETELEGYGDRVRWEREEAFDVYDDDDGDEDGDGSGSGKRLVENDRFHVRVELMEVMGPAN